MVKKKNQPRRRSIRCKTRGKNLGHPQDKSPLFMVAKKKSVEIKDGEKIDIQVICPMCMTYWADATVVYGGNVSPESFRLKEPYTATTIEQGKPLSCPACFYRYTNWAVMASVMAAMNRQAISSKMDGGMHPIGKNIGL